MTITLKFTFHKRSDVTELLSTVWTMVTESVVWLLTNNKTSLKALNAALYHPFRERFPHLHSLWVVSAEKTATSIAHAFHKRKRKGWAKKPNLRRPFVSVHTNLTRLRWDGRWLTVTFSCTPNDLAPITFSFRVRSQRYRKVLSDWVLGRCPLGQVTLTPTSLSLPFKYPDAPTYAPATVIGIDSNERSLDCYIAEANEVFSVDTSYVPKVCRDHERRIRKGTRGKSNAKAKRKIQAKHGRLRRGKVGNFWHHVALWLVALAGNLQAALVLEDLKGMAANIARRQKSKRVRQRLLNFWSIRTFHRILEWKAREYGVPLVFVDPNGTSRTCPKCGGCLRGQERVCPSCGLNRHAVAAINIARRGLEKFPDLCGLGQAGCSPPVARPLPTGRVVVSVGHGGKGWWNEAAGKSDW